MKRQRMKKAHKDLLEKIKKDIDEATEPDRMTTDEAEDFLSELMTHCEFALEALSEEGNDDD